MRDRFYLACYRDNFGGKVVFHAKNRMGYTTDINNADTLNRFEAQRAWDKGREFDKPLSADHVDEKANYFIDMQIIPSCTTFDDSDEYVAFVKDCYMGNDRLWVTREGESYIYTDPVVYSKLEAKSYISDRLKFIPKSLADSSKRKAIEVRYVNERVFIQGAGIKQPAHVRRMKRRKDSGKTRFNCPTCGRINWQYSPYDFDKCSDTFCDENFKCL